MAARVRREAGAESRDRLLGAGSSLIHELSTKEFLRSLTARVAARAGYSPGAFYHHWETQEEYIADLVDWLLDIDRAESARAVDGFFADAAHVGTEEALGAVAVASVREAMHSESFIAQLILWAQHSSDAMVGEKIRDLQRRISANTLAQFQVLFSEHGWAPAEGLDAEVASEMVCALVRGFALRCAVDEDVDPEMIRTAVDQVPHPTRSHAHLTRRDARCPRRPVRSLERPDTFPHRVDQPT